MYQLTSLNSLKKDVIPLLTYFEFNKGNKILNIKKSESFYLFSELENAVQTNVDFKPKYELLFHQNETDLNKISNIKTDGRYFKYNFENSKVVILDVGYNFIERNFKASDFVYDIR